MMQRKNTFCGRGRQNIRVRTSLLYVGEFLPNVFADDRCRSASMRSVMPASSTGLNIIAPARSIATSATPLSLSRFHVL